MADGDIAVVAAEESLSADLPRAEGDFREIGLIEHIRRGVFFGVDYR